MAQVLYRKYRPKKLSQIVGQDHITHPLTEAIKNKRIAHAYLLTGPRGVGKTSIARIMAHEINGVTYSDDTIHMDIIEIDAASNARIDEIRELREKAYTSPTSAPYKIYIIDEVHMLSKGAFNALLKILEEPPAHVIFILATTDVQKLPATIISRTQRYIFKPVPSELVISHLNEIAEQESIHITEDALQIIAEHGEGSFRDSISLLDQASNANNDVTEQTILNLLGIPSMRATDDLLTAVMQGVPSYTLVLQLNKMLDQGIQAVSIAKQLAAQLRADITDQNPQYDPRISLAVLARLLEVAPASEPDRFLEIVLLTTCLQQRPVTTSEEATTEPAIPRAKESEPKGTPAADKIIKHTASPSAKNTAVKKNDSPEAETIEPPKKTKNIIGTDEATLWQGVLDALKARYNTLYGVVRMARPNFGEGQLELTFSYVFHQKRISDAKNSKILTDILQQLTGKPYRLSCIFDKNVETSKETHAPASPAKSNQPIEAISSIFGGGEILDT